MQIDNYEFDEAEWKTDCQDKQDFDFPVLKVLTRYWGRDNTAKPTIYLGETILTEYIGYIKGKDEEETKSLTEKWIKEQVSELINKITK